MAKVWLRDSLGKFRGSGRAGTGKKVRTTRGLGRERGSGRNANSLSSGGKIAGLPASQVLANKTASSGDSEASGTKVPKRKR